MSVLFANARFIFNEHALRVLDLSFNLFKSVPDVLEHLPSLEIVYFVQNKISKITGLATAINLTSLELGGNRIRVSCERLPILR